MGNTLPTIATADELADNPYVEDLPTEFTPVEALTDGRPASTSRCYPGKATSPDGGLHREHQGIDVAATIDAVSKQYDMVFSNGYGSALGEKPFRIGPMGEHDVESVKALTDAIEDVAGL